MKFAQKDDSKNQLEFINEAERVMSRYLADKFNLSPYGLTQQVIAEKLAERAVSEDLRKEVEKFFDFCSSIRFGGLSSFETSSQEIIGLIETVIKEKL